MTHRRNHTVAGAAAKAGLSTATGYRIESDPILPSHKQAPRKRLNRTVFNPRGVGGLSAAGYRRSEPSKVGV